MFGLFCMFLDCEGDAIISKLFCDVSGISLDILCMPTFQRFALCCEKSFKNFIRLI